AQERLQGQGNGQGKGPEPIIYHPDVQRMLMTMKSHTEAMRALAYTGAAYRDMAENHADAVSRASYQALYEFLIPVIKGYCTETALEVTSLGVQVHGGMGFIEETGAAQHYRDARILPIYEGTTAIQANDLLQRKILGDKGAVVNRLLAHIDDCVAQLKTILSPDPAHQVAVGIIADELASAAGAWREATQYLIAHAGNKEAVLAGSVPYLMLTGQALCGWNVARAALVALQNMTEKSGDRFDADKFASSVFYAAHILPRTAGNARGVQHSATLSSYLASVATS
ncbi:MAG TPA: acyl-CoA dehydrogenase C-terminal domain-containing protein, partial [Advenella sp.]|nr:acyl-CoA dehydrogenase C-terminal domain-containing protein [Advenella sp.]